MALALTYEGSIDSDIQLKSLTLRTMFHSGIARRCRFALCCGISVLALHGTAQVALPVSYPEIIEARSYYTPAVAEDKMTNGWFIHTLGTEQQFLLLWGLADQEKHGLFSNTVVDIIPLLGVVESVELNWDFYTSDTSFTYQVDQEFRYADIEGGSYGNEFNPIGYQETQTSINDRRVAWLDLGFKFTPRSNGMGVVEFDKSTTATNLPFGRRAILTHDANDADRTAAGTFEYVGPIQGGPEYFWPCTDPQPPITTFLSPQRVKETINNVTNVLNPTNAIVPIAMACRLETAFTPRWGVTSVNTNEIRDASQWTWAEMGKLVGGTMLWRANARLTHRYRPRTPAGYALALLEYVYTRELPQPSVRDPIDYAGRLNIADFNWNTAIALRETSAETSAYNNALRDAEYFWRGVAGGLMVRELAIHSLWGGGVAGAARMDEFLDPVNTVGNLLAPASTEIYNVIKSGLVLAGVKQTVPPEDAEVLERMYNGEFKQQLPGSSILSLDSTQPSVMSGWRLGILNKSYAEIQQSLAELEGINNGFFQPTSLLDINTELLYGLGADLLQLIGGGSSANSTMTATGNSLDESSSTLALTAQSEQPLELIEAYVDTVEEARLAQRFYFRPTGVGTSGTIMLDVQPGPLTTPTPSPGDIIRGTVTLTCTGNKMTSLRVEGPLEQTITGRLWFFGEDGKMHHLATGEIVNLEAGSSGGMSSITIGGFDGVGLVNSQFEFHVTTSTDGQAFFGQTIYYRAEARGADWWGYDGDSDGLADQWERDHFGSTARATPDTDSDSDGIPALAEMVSGSHPGDAASRPITKLLKISESEWSLSLPARNGLEYNTLLRKSTDLVTWQSLWWVWPQEDEDQAHVPPGTKRMRYLINTEGAEQLFLQPVYCSEDVFNGGD